MGALANASLLRVDNTFKAWVTTAVVYTGRLVLLNDPTVTNGIPTADIPIRKALATNAVVSPDAVAQYFIMGVSCDPSIASMGSVTSAAMEQPIIDKTIALWTPVAQLNFPNGVQ